MAKAPSASAAARKVVDGSPAVDVTLESYVDTLNEASVDIDSPPLADPDDYDDGLEEDLMARSLGKKKTPTTRTEMSWKR
jgi:hypothetical protein